MTDIPPLPLPSGIRTGMVKTETGLTHHVLEAGEPSKPSLLLLHGFPELAYSWRKVMLPLADQGFHVIAPDQRGYGRTIGWQAGYDDDYSAFSLPCLVRDMIALVRALRVDELFAVIGHDFGSPVAACSALMRPDIFKRVVCMSAPFGGCPRIAQVNQSSQSKPSIHDDLLALDTPRKHYQWYYSTRDAASDMLNAKQGFNAFMRAYYHMKSADWNSNQPDELQGWAASELSRMPTYYIMHASETMAETVAPHDPKKCSDWLTESELIIYTDEFKRTGLQAALNWYRCSTDLRFARDLSVYDGRRIEVPATFIAGKQDWGWAQMPGALMRMETSVCSRWYGSHLIDGAGHWVQQEQPEAVVDLVADFLSDSRGQ